MARIAEVSTIPTIMHTEVLSVSRAEVISVSVVVAMCAMDVPSMSTTIGSVKMRTSKVEIVTMRVTEVDSEVPISSLPIEWTIEI